MCWRLTGWDSKRRHGLLRAVQPIGWLEDLILLFTAPSHIQSAAISHHANTEAYFLKEVKENSALTLSHLSEGRMWVEGEAENESRSQSGCWHGLLLSSGIRGVLHIEFLLPKIKYLQLQTTGASFKKDMVSPCVTVVWLSLSLSKPELPFILSVPYSLSRGSRRTGEVGRNWHLLPVLWSFRFLPQLLTPDFVLIKFN